MVQKLREDIITFTNKEQHAKR